MNGRILRPTASFAVICGALAVFAARAQTAKGISIDVLSSRPELVAGGDALVRISGIEAAPKVKLGANDVSAAFRPDSKGGWIGLVEGLKDGGNLLLAQAEGKEASLTLVNHPRNATLFSGPQQEPFVCENETFGLEPAKDQSCAAPSKVEYFYRNKGGAWKRFDPGASRPTDLATTRTTEGREVPLIVRQEKGVINRSAYLINLLHDPAAGALPTPVASSPASGWNGKLIYSFGGGVQANYHMGRGLGGMTGTGSRRRLSRSVRHARLRRRGRLTQRDGHQ